MGSRGKRKGEPGEHEAAAADGVDEGLDLHDESNYFNLDQTEDIEVETITEPKSVAPKTPVGLPIIEREANAHERIVVGGGGTLIVPREDIAADIDIGEEMDLRDLQAKKIRKPGRREWVALKRDSELPARLLVHKPKADGIEVQYYHVGSHLRSPIREELKEVRAFLYFSFTTNAHALWVVNVTVDNSWYESLQPLFGQPLEFFAEKAVRVMSDKPNSRYRVRVKPIPSAVAWPTKSTSELLGEALGPDGFITSADHPIYRDLIDGVELG